MRVNLYRTQYVGSEIKFILCLLFSKYNKTYMVVPILFVFRFGMLVPRHVSSLLVSEVVSVTGAHSRAFLKASS